MASDEHTESDPARDVVVDPEALGAARSRRLELGEVADLTEAFLARPASEPAWAARVSEALAGLRAAFGAHVDEVEKDDGLLPRVLTDVPRLANGVSRLQGEHAEIDLRINEVVDLVCGCAPDCDHTAVEEVRVEALEVLSLISRHRQAGADLVYEAYSVDIGGG